MLNGQLYFCFFASFSQRLKTALSPVYDDDDNNIICCINIYVSHSCSKDIPNDRRTRPGSWARTRAAPASTLTCSCTAARVRTSVVRRRPLLSPSRASRANLASSLPSQPMLESLDVPPPSLMWRLSQ